jgi:ribosomal protein S18 acetylase RimI-like enzyme
VPTATPTLDPHLAGLFGRVWPTLPGAVDRAAALGFPWAAVSRPFVRREPGRAVAHVGLIEVPLVIEGRDRRAGSIHAVCTDPEARGRGFATALMREAPAACDTRYETVLLTTSIPALYERLGFRSVREHAFAGSLPARRRAGPEPRPLTTAADDVALLRRLLDARVPVSRRLGATEDGTIFVVGLLLTWGDLSRVRYLPALDAVAVYEVLERTLVLYHVLGANIPSLDALAGAIGAEADRVVVLFAPDQLDTALEPQAWDATRAASIGAAEFVELMVRGPLPVGGPFMLPTLSRT